MEEPARHTMKVASARSGLSPYLIRMWERRYQAVAPNRTETNRRLFTDEDIQRLILLRRARLAGESMGQLARLNNEQLRRVVRSLSGPEEPAVEDPAVGSRSPAHHHERCLDAVSNFDAASLESRLFDASVALGQQPFMEQVVQPLLTTIGRLWATGELRVAHEHLASAVARSLLEVMVVTGRAEKTAPLLVATTPSGQLHEIGALMSAVTAVSVGWRAVYLGPNLPAEDIAAAARQSGARAIALSLVYPPDDPRVEVELRKLPHMLPDGSTLLAGGRAAERYRPVLEAVGARLVTDLSDLKALLNELRNHYPTP